MLFTLRFMGISDLFESMFPDWKVRNEHLTSMTITYSLQMDYERSLRYTFHLVQQTLIVPFMCTIARRIRLWQSALGQNGDTTLRPPTTPDCLFETFGCCEDGLTKALGSDNQGCHPRAQGDPCDCNTLGTHPYLLCHLRNLIASLTNFILLSRGWKVFITSSLCGKNWLFDRASCVSQNMTHSQVHLMSITVVMISNWLMGNISNWLPFFSFKLVIS